MTSYILETIEPVGFEPFGRCWHPRFERRWIGTYLDRAAADAAFDDAKRRAGCLAAALFEWHPGTRDSTATLQHGSYGTRGTAGGMPTERPVRHAERACCQGSDMRPYTVAPEMIEITVGDIEAIPAAGNQGWRLAVEFVPERQAIELTR